MIFRDAPYAQPLWIVQFGSASVLPQLNVATVVKMKSSIFDRLESFMAFDHRPLTSQRAF